MSTFGKIFTLTTYGESHGPGLGGIVCGCPSGIALNEAMLQSALNTRKPGTGIAGTSRKESDTVRILSGIFEGKSTGSPIAFHIANENQRSGDYSTLAYMWRPGHADRSYDLKYGCRDYRGGGRSSARETASRVAGGAIAQALLDTVGIKVHACTVELGGIAAWTEGIPDNFNISTLPSLDLGAPNTEAAKLWMQRVQEVRSQGDTLGGIVRIEAHHVPPGLGEPVFDKLDAVLAMALMSVGAVKGIEFGLGFEAAKSLGSHNNDALLPDPNNHVDHALPGIFASNHCGGIVGGISTGQPIVLQVAVKPIPSIAKEQHSLDSQGKLCHLRVGGRHDICAIPRILPVLKAMTALVLADMLLLQQRMVLGQA